MIGLALGLGFPASADEAARIALVIGNAHYEHVPMLRNSTNDAQLMAGILHDLGFKLVGGGARLDLDRTSLELAIRDFSDALTPGAIAFFYYSGHGIQIQGNNYLVPTGANPTSDRDVDFDMVDVGLLLRQLEESGTSLNVLVLDACRNNPFGGRGLRDVAAGLAQMQAPRGTIIAYATQPGGVAADGEGADSPYTTALAATMQRPGLGIIDMFNDVAVAVDRATNHVQQPWTALSPITQSFYLVAKGVDASPQSSLTAGTPRPAPQSLPAVPNSADREVVFWESVQNRGSVVELQTYLQRFPNGLFADLARARIGELESAIRSQTPPTDRATPTPMTDQQRAAAKPAAPAPSPDVIRPSQIADAPPAEADTGALAPPTDQQQAAAKPAAPAPSPDVTRPSQIADAPPAEADTGALAPPTDQQQAAAKSATPALAPPPEVVGPSHADPPPADHGALPPLTDEQQVAVKLALPVLPPSRDVVGPSQIADAQRLLLAIGFGIGQPDGILGPRTRDAIRAFQLSVGMPTDARVSGELLGRLRGPSPSRQTLATALIKLAEDCTHAGKTLDAVNLYTEATELDPANGESLTALGDLQKSLGNIEDAKRSYMHAQSNGGTIGQEAGQRLESLPLKPGIPAPGHHTIAGEAKAALTPSIHASPRATVPASPAEALPVSPSQWVVTASTPWSANKFVGKNSDKEIATREALENCRNSFPARRAPCSVASQRLEGKNPVGLIGRLLMRLWP